MADDVSLYIHEEYEGKIVKDKSYFRRAENIHQIVTLPGQPRNEGNLGPPRFMEIEGNDTNSVSSVSPYNDTLHKRPTATAPLGVSQTGDRMSHATSSQRDDLFRGPHIHLLRHNIPNNVLQK